MANIMGQSEALARYVNEATFRLNEANYFSGARRRRAADRVSLGAAFVD